mmetsp:Transcript_1390/g.2193  ORF Transcript_1390/g.2193 Transcript_1390/m.2193 type:complete len:321 (-) Transcript_1390:224-1186(-)
MADTVQRASALSEKDTAETDVVAKIEEITDETTRLYDLTESMFLNYFEGLDIAVEDLVYYKQMTDTQKGTYETFKARFAEEIKTYDGFDRSKPYTLPDDHTLLKFLQADKYNIDVAMKRMLGTIGWRQKWNISELVKNGPNGLKEYREIRVRRHMGFDKDGLPIFAERLGKFMNLLQSSKAKSISTDDLMRCYIYDMGGLIEQFRESARRGNPRWKIIYIADARHAKLMSAFKAINILRSFAKEIETNFPEQAGPIFVIHCPKIVTKAYQLICKLLDPSVVAKIRLFSNEGTQAMLERMDKATLLEEYGGTNPTEYPQAG